MTTTAYVADDLSQDAAQKPANGTQYEHVSLSRIHPDPNNPRDSLGDLTEISDSITENGLLQPIRVREHPTRPGHYMIVTGHRRLEAARAIQAATVPAIVALGEAHATPADQKFAALIENHQRRDLTALEKAAAIQFLVDAGHTLSEVSRRTGMSASTVSRLHALNELDDDTKQLVKQGTIKVGVAIDAVLDARAARAATGGRRPAAAPSAPSPQAARDGRPRSSGRPVPPRPRSEPAKVRVEPDHFSTAHPLAARAADICIQLNHPPRTRIGDLACGGCWEMAIRRDERELARAQRLKTRSGAR